MRARLYGWMLLRLRRMHHRELLLLRGRIGMLLLLMRLGGGLLMMRLLGSILRVVVGTGLRVALLCAVRVPNVRLLRRGVGERRLRIRHIGDRRGVRRLPGKRHVARGQLLAVRLRLHRRLLLGGRESRSVKTGKRAAGRVHRLDAGRVGRPRRTG